MSKNSSKMVLKLPCPQKRTFWAFEKDIFQGFFTNFWVTKLKPFSGKVRKSVQNCLNQNLVIGSFFKNGFEATLSSKTNVLSVWEGDFLVFCKFLSDKVETVFWENETIPRKHFPQSLPGSEFYRKCFSVSVWSL